MPPLKQNVAIARLLGYRIFIADGNHGTAWCNDNKVFSAGGAYVIVPTDTVTAKRQVREVPDYTTSLDLMHDAWCTITREQHAVFRQWLQFIVARDGKESGPCMSTCNASASSATDSSPTCSASAR